ncbi:SAVED domain-containing protein [Actinoallomurus bryophytorum]
MLQIEMEVNDAGNVDDVIVRHRTAPHRYTQVKYAASAATPVNTSYLTSRRRGSTSLLEKFYSSWKLLRERPGGAILELVTNRELDATDPLLKLCDGRTDMLMPAADRITDRSEAGKTLIAWAQHLGVDRGTVQSMLEQLVFRTGRKVSAEEERATALMLAAGLRADKKSLLLGTSTIAEWVRQGRRVLTRDDIQGEVEALALRTSEPRAILLIQAIRRDPHPDDATIAVDWVDLYEGDEPAARRRPKESDAWTRMDAELRSAVQTLEDGGHRDILVSGKMRLGTAFTVGARLAQVTGTSISYDHYGTVWSSDSPRIPVPALRLTRTPLGQGDDLAVAFGITRDPTNAVVSYLRKNQIPVRELLTLVPADGDHDQSVAGPGQAVTLAQELRNQVRTELERQPADRIHLFQACPCALALLTGHRWNRVARTLVYEDLGAGHGYLPAFTVSA